MGMFDNIQCDMPLPDGAYGVREWQTKDLDRSMKHYAIRSDGHLVDAQVRMEPKPGAPELPPLMSENYLSVYREWWERKEGPDVPVDFTGRVKFYGKDGDGEWWEFCASIDDGTCLHIAQIRP